MSGAVAAHASYNGSGTQGLAVTNKITSNDSDVMSLFYNKNDTTRQLLYGSSIMEIPTSGVSGTTSWGGNQIFTVNNDIDALGDLYIQVGVKCAAAPVTSKTGQGIVANGTLKAVPDGFTFNNFGLASIIDRVEFQVGTQIWQTLENDDILACNCTEMGEGVFKKFGVQANGFVNTMVSNWIHRVELPLSMNPILSTRLVTVLKTTRSTAPVLAILTIFTTTRL